MSHPRRADSETETARIIRAKPDAPVPCSESATPCRWERERQDIWHAIRTQSEVQTQILQRLATGAERMRSLDDLDKAVSTLGTKVGELSQTVAVLSSVVQLLRAIMFTGIGIVLTTILVAVLALVVLKPQPANAPRVPTTSTP